MFIRYALYKDGKQFSVLENSFEVESVKTEDYYEVFKKHTDVLVFKQLCDIADKFNYAIIDQINNCGRFIAEFRLIGLQLEKFVPFTMEKGVDFKFSDSYLDVNDVSLVLEAKNNALKAFMNYLKEANFVL